MTKTHVLLAVSQYPFLTSLKNILELENWIKIVGIADNEKQALELVNKHSPEVVVIDFDFNEDGIKMGEKILKEKPLTKIIMLSIYDYIGKLKVKKVTPQEIEIAELFDWISKDRGKSARFESVVGEFPANFLIE